MTDPSAALGSSRSFATVCSHADEQLGRALDEARAAVPSAVGGLLFLAGTLAQELDRAAALVRAHWPGVAALVVPGAGVLTERGEIERTGAASGILWSGGSAEALPLGQEAGAADVGDTLRRAAEGRAATALLFCRPDWFHPDKLETAFAGLPEPDRLCLFGAGTVGAAPIGVHKNGELLEGPLAVLLIRGLAPPLVEASPACSLISDFARIDEISGGLVVRLGGRPALDVLSGSASRLSANRSTPGGPQPLVFAAIGPDREPEHENEPGPYVVRPLRGIDPSRRGVLIGPDARPGGRMAFAVLDPAASRSGLEAAARRVARAAMGSAPRFAVYLSCAGRGEGLYGAPDVEARILRERFGDLPIAGMHSAFEIAPLGSGPPTMHLYTGVLALFRSPS